MARPAGTEDWQDSKWLLSRAAGFQMGTSSEEAAGSQVSQESQAEAGLSVGGRFPSFSDVLASIPLL